MRWLQVITMFVGRVLLSLIFLYGAFLSITNWDATMGMVTAKGLTYVSWFLGAAVALQILGGLFLLVGYKVRLGAFFLIVFLIPVTIIMHDFWSLTDASRQLQTIMFGKNLAILGGLLYVLACGSCCSSDRGSAKKLDT